MEEEKKSYWEFVEGIIGREIRADNEKSLRRLSNEDLAAIRERYLEGYYRFGESVKSNVKLITNRDPESEAISSFSPAEIGSLLPRFASAPIPYSCPREKRGEMRPLFHGKFNRSADEFGGDSPFHWITSPNNRRLSLLKRYLIYAHRIVLPDPLFYINEAANPLFSDPSRTRAALPNYLD